MKLRRSRVILTAVALFLGAGMVLLDEMIASHDRYYFPETSPPPAAWWELVGVGPLYTAGWGLVLAALAWGAGALRRGLRRRFGRCIACGYDLCGLVDAEKGKTVCPECGSAAVAGEEMAG